MTNFDKVGIFMKTFGQDVKDKPSLSTDKINKLRLSLIKEELDELKEAMKNKDFLVFEGKDKREQATEVSKIISNLVMPTRKSKQK